LHTYRINSCCVSLLFTKSHIDSVTHYYQASSSFIDSKLINDHVVIDSATHGRRA
jgi:hypothetical protein